ncbi:MAG: FeoA family protein [Thermodesulfobacteriota bacterium]
MFPLGLLAIGERAVIAKNEFCRGAEEAPRSGHGKGHVHGYGHGHTCRGCGMHGNGGGGSPARIEDLGIRPGKTVEMLNNEGGRALLVKVDEARIALGRSMAMKIMVRRKQDESGDA